MALTFEHAFWDEAVGGGASNAPLQPGTLLGACTGAEAGVRGMFSVFVVGATPNTLIGLASGEAARKVSNWAHTCKAPKGVKAHRAPCTVFQDAGTAVICFDDVMRRCGDVMYSS